jgi:hypothetical protein
MRTSSSDSPTPAHCACDQASSPFRVIGTGSASPQSTGSGDLYKVDGSTLDDLPATASVTGRDPDEPRSQRLHLPIPRRPRTSFRTLDAGSGTSP